MDNNIKIQIEAYIKQLRSERDNDKTPAREGLIADSKLKALKWVLLQEKKPTTKEIITMILYDLLVDLRADIAESKIDVGRNYSKVLDYIDNDLAFFDVVYLKQKPDGDLEQSMADLGESLNLDEAFELLSIRIKNTYESIL